ncbi:ribulokinase [Jiulongibacter sediminis]|uniref:Ribulokinase n=1 Tax=Jiulongibacter sediminis TaxID=1605367 RepID=A0A0P7C386_9BACT|nr:ribulokinase [Jiulongibacter sediminis]KPM48706.1 ribulokinase [Jiulongibacter sediminis]TBX25241.1 ribulokinase [Jiulongibacter sediminis]
MSSKYVIGIDFGSDSVRSVVVDAADGKIQGTAVAYYPRWKEGLYCLPGESQFRQHPKDYLETLEKTVKEALKEAGSGVAEKVVGISVDTTGSTPVAVDKSGTPLALTQGFEENPNAMFILWKDHTGNAEAEEINTLARKWETDFTKYEGGIYSSEWFWAKILRTLRVDEKVRKAAFSWVEHCDWISAELTGETDPLKMKRSRCAAGHKAMWHEDFDGLPSENFLTELDPVLSGLRDRLFTETCTSDEAIGTLSKEWAQKLGLNENVVIGVGAFDAHMGGIGAEIEPYSFVRVMGTSTCDMLVSPNNEMEGKLIPGICGQVDGSILPGMLGMEAGQSAYGDVYAWFARLITGPVAEILGPEQADKLQDALIPYLADEAAKLPLTENDPIAIDWFNGRRTPDANHTLKGAIAGMNLGTDAPMIFKALVEATAFGSKAIVDRFLEQQVPIKQVIAIGGVAQKSSFVMQTLADVLNMPIKVAASDQTCALGAAMCAATASGVFEKMEDAQKAMGAGFNKEYQPNAEKHKVYLKLYDKYQKFGGFIENEYK